MDGQILPRFPPFMRSETAQTYPIQRAFIVWRKQATAPHKPMYIAWAMQRHCGNLNWRWHDQTLVVQHHESRQLVTVTTRAADAPRLRIHLGATAKGWLLINDQLFQITPDGVQVAVLADVPRVVATMPQVTHTHHQAAFQASTVHPLRFYFANDSSTPVRAQLHGLQTQFEIPAQQTVQWEISMQAWPDLEKITFHGHGLRDGSHLQVFHPAQLKGGLLQQQSVCFRAQGQQSHTFVVLPVACTLSSTAAPPQSQPLAPGLTQHRLPVLRLAHASAETAYRTITLDNPTDAPVYVSLRYARADADGQWRSHQLAYLYPLAAHTPLTLAPQQRNSSVQLAIPQDARIESVSVDYLGTDQHPEWTEALRQRQQLCLKPPKMCGCK